MTISELVSPGQSEKPQVLKTKLPKKDTTGITYNSIQKFLRVAYFS